MENRQRSIQQKFFVSEEELAVIEAKMSSFGFANKSQYYRKMALDGFIIQQDYSAIKDLAREINKIGVNVNQIVHRVNAKSFVAYEDIALLQERIDEMWHLLRSTLLKQL